MLEKFNKNPYLSIVKQSQPKNRQIMSTENQVKPAKVAKVKIDAKGPKKQITIEALRELMLGGMNRKQIAEHFGAPASVINKFFKHPDLASLRPKHASEFELVDDSGKTYSPGYLANAAKEAKEAEQVEEVTEEVAEADTTEEVAEQAPVTESTGI